MRIELHCHSTHSDGSFSATEVAELAFARGVALFCLTDHDTCAGYEATCAAFPAALCGVELSCVANQQTVHLLIYRAPSSSGDWPSLELCLEEQQKARRDRVHLIAERLGALGASFDPQSLLDRCEGVVGRPHVAQELVRLGIVSSRAEAFERYLKDGGPGDVRIERLSLAEGLALGLAAGGRMSLAHPHMHGQGAEALVREYKSQGLTGLEVYYGLYKPPKRKVWEALAESEGLVQTGGSDFHGASLPRVQRPGVEMPDSVVDRLLEWLEFPRDKLLSA